MEQREIALAHRLILEAIRLEVERFDFDALPELPELRDLLILAAEVAAPIQRVSNDEVSQQAAQETKIGFERLVRNFDSTLLVEPLPYRRVLFGAELKAADRILEERWGAKGYFYPLDEARSSYAPTYFAYDSNAFEAAFPTEKLVALLREHGVNRVYELREFGDDNYLEDVEIMEPSYTGAEVFISSEKWDWLFYASHEASITTAGWLTQAVRDAWPEWEAAKYDPSWRR